MRLAVDVNFMEIVERCPNTECRETELEQNEEKQRDYNDRYECEGNFSYIGHRVLSLASGK